VALRLQTTGVEYRSIHACPNILDWHVPDSLAQLKPKKSSYEVIPLTLLGQSLWVSGQRSSQRFVEGDRRLLLELGRGQSVERLGN